MKRYDSFMVHQDDAFFIALHSSSFSAFLPCGLRLRIALLPVLSLFKPMFLTLPCSTSHSRKGYHKPGAQIECGLQI